MNNRLHNVTNPYQGKFKKVLCVCSAGLLRSPTAALVLSQAPYCYNTRAVGIDSDHALIPIDQVMVSWANEIVCMSERQAQLVTTLFKVHKDTTVVSLEIEDCYSYREVDLIELIKDKYNSFIGNSLLVDE